jgi:hypothetical protein
MLDRVKAVATAAATSELLTVGRVAQSVRPMGQRLAEYNDRRAVTLVYEPALVVPVSVVGAGSDAISAAPPALPHAVAPTVGSG